MIADDIAAALPELRAHAESMMVDSCLITRQRLDPNGEPVRTMDPDTLELTYVWDEVYAGKCRVQRFRGQGLSDVMAGEVEFGKAYLQLQVPIAVLGVRPKDRVTFTAVGAISDPALLSEVATVVDDLSKTHATKRTLMCEVVQADG